MIRYLIFITIFHSAFLSAESLAQVEDLTEDDKIAIVQEAEFIINDYADLMNKLADPNIESYQKDDIINDQVRSIFTDSAELSVDFEAQFFPPNNSKEKFINQYLDHFRLSYLKNEEVLRAKIRYYAFIPSEVKWSEENSCFFLSVRFRSKYTGLRPHDRRATMKAEKVGDNWKVVITSVYFDYNSEDLQKKKILNVEPEWKVLANQAEDSLKSQKFESALKLIQQSLALDSTAQNLKLMGKYYQDQEDIEPALEYFLLSIKKGLAADSAYQDEETILTIKQLKDELLKQKEEEERKALAEREAAIALEQVNKQRSSILARQAESFLIDEEYEMAYDLLQQSLALDSTAINLKLLGQYFQEQKQLKDALNHYILSLDKGLATEPGYQDVETSLAVREISIELNKQRKEKAKKEKIKEPSSPKWFLLTKRAEEFLDKSDFDVAFDLLQQSFALDSNAYNLKLMGQYYYDQGQFEQASKYYIESLQKGIASDHKYRDDRTTQALKKIGAELAKRKTINSKKEEVSLPESSEESKVVSKVTKTIELPDSTTKHGNEILSNQVHVNSQFSDINKRYKRGKKVDLAWNITGDKAKSVMLYRRGKEALTLNPEYYANQYLWKIPKRIKPGRGYQFRIVEPETGVAIESGKFSIRRRFPKGLQFALGLGVVAGVIAWGEDRGEGKGPGWWNLLENPIPGPQIPK